MESLANYLIVFVALNTLFIGDCQDVFNVVNYGAVGDGVTDDSQAFLRAWQALCEATGSSQTLVIPSDKTFFLQPLKFQGPCKSDNVKVQVLGNIVAPNAVAEWAPCVEGSWIAFIEVKGLDIDGSGNIDGQGSVWWSQDGKVPLGAKCNERPTALHLHGCNNLQLRGVSLANSPRNHISLSGSSDVSISNIHINAPVDSPNTDGIDISSSQHINIVDSFIASGDDCVAINDKTVDINITHVVCGPGHGISVGSLGKNGAHETVEQVHVRNCTFNGTKNGARIKTWAGGSGYAKQISFEQITLINADNPIIIDQHYCNGAHGCGELETTAVEVSDVTYSGFTGTCAKKRAITLDCDSRSGCNNIIMDDITITPSDLGTQLEVVCNNAHGKATSTVPEVPCLSQ